MTVAPTAQSLTALGFALGRAVKRVALWRQQSGDVAALSWTRVTDALATADVAFIAARDLSRTSQAIIRVTGDIAPHRHRRSNSTGMVLGRHHGFPDPPGNAEIFLDGAWRQVEPGDLAIFAAGTVHGFRGIGHGPLYALFLDSLPIDDAMDHIVG